MVVLTLQKKSLNTAVIWGIKWRFWLPYFCAYGRYEYRHISCCLNE